MNAYNILGGGGSIPTSSSSPPSAVAVMKPDVDARPRDSGYRTHRGSDAAATTTRPSTGASDVVFRYASLADALDRVVKKYHAGDAADDKINTEDNSGKTNNINTGNIVNKSGSVATPVAASDPIKTSILDLVDDDLERFDHLHDHQKRELDPFSDTHSIDHQDPFKDVDLHIGGHSATAAAHHLSPSSNSRSTTTSRRSRRARSSFRRWSSSWFSTATEAFHSSSGRRARSRRRSLRPSSSSSSSPRIAHGAARLQRFFFKVWDSIKAKFTAAQMIQRRNSRRRNANRGRDNGLGCTWTGNRHGSYTTSINAFVITDEDDGFADPRHHQTQAHNNISGQQQGYSTGRRRDGLSNLVQNCVRRCRSVMSRASTALSSIVHRPVALT